MELVDAIERHCSDFNHRVGRECRKICYRSPSAAKKALKLHGFGIGAKSFYRCHHHGTDKVWHITKVKKGDYKNAL